MSFNDIIFNSIVSYNNMDNSVSSSSSFFFFFFSFFGFFFDGFDIRFGGSEKGGDTFVSEEGG